MTEAGTLRQGTVKNACGVGILLEQGIGDTMRLSLTADPVEEAKVAWDLLSALGMRRLTPELVSCPTCGRCQVDMIAHRRGGRASACRRFAPPSPSPSWAAPSTDPARLADADIGMASGRGQAMLFAKGEPIRKVPEDRMVDELFDEIRARFS